MLYRNQFRCYYHYYCYCCCSFIDDFLTQMKALNTMQFFPRREIQWRVRGKKMYNIPRIWNDWVDCSHRTLFFADRTNKFNSYKRNNTHILCVRKLSCKTSWMNFVPFFSLSQKRSEYRLTYISEMSLFDHCCAVLSYNFVADTHTNMKWFHS